MKKNSLHTWLDASSRVQRQRLAKLAKTSPRTIDHVAKGHRTASAEWALRIEHASVRMRGYHSTRHLPVILREDLATACGVCEFASACRGAAS